ncbi:MAG: glutamate-5-semialdehyde dehydrogenase [bacterium]|nr:glutamate-5-semialdehyde dehydrogenase [Acidimicrobiia bacterium]MCY4651263.1 glutamate-5-semialdehyde dehydrogenase [bacterium]
MAGQLTNLTPGMAIPFGGDRVTMVSEELAAAFTAGDRLVVVQSTGDLLRIPSADWEIASAAVGRAHRAFTRLGGCSDQQITDFYEAFARRLTDDEVFAPIAEANRADVEAAQARGRTTTRLVLSDKMRTNMVEGLRTWRDASSGRGEIIETVPHKGWEAQLVRSGLGVVGFVFEGRPNVFADATGVLRSGNTVVFRIGSAALGTARAIVEHALDPALAETGLPEGAVGLVDSPTHAVGWALFSQPKLSLAVARGSGHAVGQLGAVARQSGISVSLHGTGGGWMVAGPGAHASSFAKAVRNSLDRKVCNTVNVCAIVRSRSAELAPVFLDALRQAAERRGVNPKLWVTGADRSLVPDEWFRSDTVTRAEGEVTEPITEVISDDGLGTEWEWEESPEVTLTVVESVAEAVELFNSQSPKLVASLIDDDPVAQTSFYETVDAPFVGNGFTRWVDGQFALNRPELGLSNWEGGRLFGRGGVLSGDSVFTIRTRVIQNDPDISR